MFPAKSRHYNKDKLNISDIKGAQPKVLNINSSMPPKSNLKNNLDITDIMSD